MQSGSVRRRRFIAHEKALFKHMRGLLRRVAHLPLDELYQFALSHACVFITKRDAWAYFTHQRVEYKTRKWARFWSRWHHTGRGCPFSPGQMAVGQARSLLNRQKNASFRAFLSHVLHRQGQSYRFIAAKLRCSVGTVAADLKKSYAFLEHLFSLVSRARAFTKSNPSISPSRRQTEQIPLFPTLYPQKETSDERKSSPRPTKSTPKTAAQGMADYLTVPPVP